MPKKPKPEPILIPCEGSGARGHITFGDDYVVLCAMCGKTFWATGSIVPQHDRNDILAMLQRGDFDG